MNNRVTTPLVLLFTIIALTHTAQGKDYLVYYLGGQSNMDGYGRVNDLPEELKGGVDGVMIFHGNTARDGVAVDGRGVWAELKPGHGVGFSSDGKTNKPSDRFGVELTFARKIKELNPEANIAIIKYSRGGTSIHEGAAAHFGCWEPDYEGGSGAGQGINQYDHFLATIRGAMAARDIDGDGEDDSLTPAGILWMQGESDAHHTQEIAEGYEENLRRLMDLVRAALRTDDLPVAIGRISDSRAGQDKPVWKFGDIVRAKQASYTEADKNATLVTSTDKYGYSDPYHYNSAGYIELGKEFAKALAELGN